MGRHHPCSFMVGTSIAVDMGAVASRLSLAEQAGITDILLSHPHLDHIKDLPFFAENIFTLSTAPVAIHGNPDTIAKLKANLFNSQLWPDFTVLPSKAKPILRYEPFEVAKPFRIGALEVFAVPVTHPGGCVAFFLKGDRGTILYTGDTGPTEAVWDEANRRGDEIQAVLLETSFPNRLSSVAEESGHHTPATLSKEIRKIKSGSVPIFIYHLKAPYHDETVAELREIEDPRLRMLEAGMTLEF